MNSREIKFRAWADDIMFQPTKITFADQLVYCYDPNNDYDFQIELKYLMQYTGIKDKNGTEIYEGDIVKATASFYSSTPSASINQVIWIDESAQFGFEGWGDRTIDEFFGIEVIGNIYENPKLLEEAHE